MSSKIDPNGNNKTENVIAITFSAQADAVPPAPGFKIPAPPAGLLGVPQGLLDAERERRAPTMNVSEALRSVGIDNLPRGAVVEQAVEDASTTKIAKPIDLTKSAVFVLMEASNHTDEAEIAKAHAHLGLRKRTALYHDIHVRAMTLTVYGNDPRLVYVCFAGRRSLSIAFPVFEHAERFADFYALSIIDGHRPGMIAPTDQEYADFIAARADQEYADFIAAPRVADVDF